MDVLDALTPDEAHLPPSRRTWARVIRPDGYDILEMRDPNDGQSADPADRTRYQYRVARGYLWRRVLPPAPLDQLDEPASEVAGWRLVAPAATRRGMSALPNPDYWPWEWALSQGVLPYTIEPICESGDRNPDGRGYRLHTLYRMPPAHPDDQWADITSGAGPEGIKVPCPVDGCGQHLVWWEAGNVPGYRVCMAGAGSDGYDTMTIRHRYQLDHAREWPEMTLVRR